MKKRVFAILSLILVLFCSVGLFSACGEGGNYYSLTCTKGMTEEDPWHYAYDANADLVNPETRLAALTSAKDAGTFTWTDPEDSNKTESSLGFNDLVTNRGAVVSGFTNKVKGVHAMSITYNYTTCRIWYVVE